jgi:hypothetical protein
LDHPEATYKKENFKAVKAKEQMKNEKEEKTCTGARTKIGRIKYEE